jgi:flagellar biosynthesis component FlhA
MDKLAKDPPKGIQRLKENPIAQGIVSNALFQVGWGAVSAMIAWIIGHYALIGGIPPYLAIFLAVVAFFLMALSYNQIRRRRDARALNTATVEPQTESEREAIERIGEQHDQLQVQLHFAEQEIATLKGEKGRLSREKEKLAKDLANEKANAEAQ